MKQLFIILSTVVLISACNQNKNSLEGKKTELAKLEGQAKELKGKIDVLKKEIEKLDTAKKVGLVKDVITLPTTLSNFSHFIEIQGMVESENNVLVNPKMGGLITSVNVVEGQQVSAGQVLATIDNSVLATSVAEIENQLSLAEIVFQKQERLWNQKIGTEIQYLQAKNNKEALEKRLKTTRAQLAMSKIVAPFSGVVDEVNIKVGETAMPGMGGIRIVNMNTLKVIAKVADSYVGSIKKGDKVNIKISDLNLEFNSIISYAALNVSTTSRTFIVEVKVPSSVKNLRPNLVAKMLLNDANEKNKIVIPVNAIQKSSTGDNTVLVAVKNNNTYTVKQKVVQLGLSYNNQTVIKEGLAPEELLIIQGGEDLLEGQVVNIIK